MILRKLWNIAKKSWSTLFIVSMKATFVMSGNCNVPLTESRFVFSRDISTSRYRCVCKSVGIISRCKRQIINIQWIKKREARQWPLRVSLLTMARSIPRYFPHGTSFSHPICVCIHINMCLFRMHFATIPFVYDRISIIHIWLGLIKYK